MAILFPILLAIVIGIVQVGLWAYANSVAQAAADRGAEVASAFNADARSGEEAALAFLDEVGSVRDAAARATFDSASDQVNVVVTASYPSVFGRLHVEARATGVRERLPAP